MKTQPRAADSRGNGRSAPVLSRDLAVEPPAGRRVRVPELLIGAAITVTFALAAVLWHASSTERVAVLVASVDIDRGSIVEASDMRVAHIGADDTVASVAAGRSSELVGRTASADIQAGSLMTSGLVTDLPALAPGEGIVGLALDPGQYPARRLAPGDVVSVVGPGTDGDPEVLTEAAIVHAIEELGGQGRRLISVRAPEPDALQVAAAAERGPVRLVLVGR